MASHTTRDHQEIRQWADTHGAIPAIISRNGGLLRFEFAADEVAELGDLNWNEFFRIFDERGLELIYDDKPGSRFHKLAYPETAAARVSRRAPPPRAHATRAPVHPIRSQARTPKPAPKAKPRATKPAGKKSTPRPPRKAA